MRPARGGDVTDTWDSSRAAGSRAPAEREANLNANQELQRAPRRVASLPSRILSAARSDPDCFSRLRPRHLSLARPIRSRRKLESSKSNDRRLTQRRPVKKLALRNSAHANLESILKFSRNYGHLFECNL